MGHGKEEGINRYMRFSRNQRIDRPRQKWKKEVEEDTVKFNWMWNFKEAWVREWWKELRIPNFQIPNRSVELILIGCPTCICSRIYSGSNRRKMLIKFSSVARGREYGNRFFFVTILILVKEEENFSVWGLMYKHKIA